MMDQKFEIRIVIFENFFKLSKRRHAVPLRPIWTIMVAAKLDQSRVLVTKFRQNRLTLKGRSAGQRHTDRQTNSAENDGPSGLQLGQQCDNWPIITFPAKQYCQCPLDSTHFLSSWGQQAELVWVAGYIPRWRTISVLIRLNVHNVITTTLNCHLTVSQPTK